jgi:hypothetical protein
MAVFSVTLLVAAMRWLPETSMPVVRDRYRSGAVAPLSCVDPILLRIQRFEDGSAKLRCGDRLLARISSPG